MEEADDQRLRIDKYLWSIRLFKTRADVVDACKGGRVKINGQKAKPAHAVKIGDIYVLQKGSERKEIKVIGLLARRVSAEIALTFYEDLTPVTQPAISTQKTPVYQRGADRPTKKQRRSLEAYLDQ